MAAPPRRSEIDERRLVVDHFDRLARGIGGVDARTRGLARYATCTWFGFAATYRAGKQPRGRWSWLEVAVPFRTSPRCYAESGGTRMRVPNALRLGAGLLRHASTNRRNAAEVVQAHRPEVALLVRRLSPHTYLNLSVYEDAINWTAETSGSPRVRTLPRYHGVQERAGQVADPHDEVIPVPAWFDPNRLQNSPRQEPRGISSSESVGWRQSRTACWRSRRWESFAATG